MPSTKAKRFYVSWVAVNNDPWPFRYRDRDDREYLPVDNRLWPGLPVINRDGQQLIDTGPTLAALFHPKSQLVDAEGLTNLDRIYLLYEQGRGNSEESQSRLKHAIEVLCRVRGLETVVDRVEYVPIEGINDPNDPEQVMNKLEEWINNCDPFEVGRRNSIERHVTINLNPGTSTGFVCWLMLRWNGVLPGTPLFHVHWLLGDGGPPARRYRTEDERQPVREFDFETLAQFTIPAVTPPPTAPPDEFDQTLLKCPLFIDLYAQIDKAAFLGLPILLTGERGSGKTFLARYYHDRRQHYRDPKALPPAPASQESTQKGKDKAAVRQDASTSPRTPSVKGGQFITVTLSEYPDVEKLRAELFGWERGAFTGANQPNEGFLGHAHQGTLFLDEIHHLPPPLQAALLGPLNNKTYNRMGEPEQSTRSDFDLVVATNDVQRYNGLMPDFRDRIERIALPVPSFADLQKRKGHIDDIWHMWEFVFKRRCSECGVTFETGLTPDCRAELNDVFTHKPLKGNWRDLHRLADHILLYLTDARMGRPQKPVWGVARLREAITKSFP